MKLYLTGRRLFPAALVAAAHSRAWQIAPILHWWVVYRLQALHYSQVLQNIPRPARMDGLAVVRAGGAVSGHPRAPVIYA
jgi:hypothetical protein